MIAPVALGLAMFVLSLCVQAVSVVILIRILTSKQPGSLTRPTYAAHFLLLLVAALLASLAHLLTVAMWAGLFLLCGEFADFATAFYHSAVNYSSLGYGDIVMSSRWRLLGPLEALDGVVMSGISTALLVALVMRLIERRLKDKSAEENPGPERTCSGQ